MSEQQDKLPEGEVQQRQMDEELEHLEEDIGRQGFFSKIGDVFKKLFSAEKDADRQERHETRDG